jgi:hypothetical protein
MTAAEHEIPKWTNDCLHRMKAAFPDRAWEYTHELGSVTCAAPGGGLWIVYYADDECDEALFHWWVANTGDSKGAHPHDPVKAMQTAIKRDPSPVLVSTKPRSA